MSEHLIAIIGGSGFYKFLPDATEIKVETPFSKDPIVLSKGKIEGRDVIFMPRHGSGHSIPPHKIDFRANIYALHKVGVKRIISTTAVGSVRKEILPGMKARLGDWACPKLQQGGRQIS